MINRFKDSGPGLIAWSCNIDILPALQQLLPVVLMRYDVQVDYHSFFVAGLWLLYILLSDEYCTHNVHKIYYTAQVCIGQNSW